MYFTAKIFNMHIISMGTDLNVCRGVFRTQTNIYGGASLRKSQKSVIVDVWLGSKYVSSIDFTIENVYRSHYLFDITNSTSKICHCVLVEGVICSQVFCCYWHVQYIQPWIKSIQDGLFRDQKSTPCLNSVTHILQW